MPFHQDAALVAICKLEPSTSAWLDAPAGGALAHGDVTAIGPDAG